jgi:hypothetical protein
MPEWKELFRLAFHILLSLLDGERHGHALKREILARTKGKLAPAPSLLYGTVNRLLEQGLIEASDERPDAQLDDTSEEEGKGDVVVLSHALFEQAFGGDTRVLG